MSSITTSMTATMDQMLNLGILIESIAGYPDLPMTSAIDRLLLDNNNTVPERIAKVLAGTGVKDADATVRGLQEYLRSLPHGESLAQRNINAFVIMTVLGVMAVALRLYVRRFITRTIRAEEWWCTAGLFGTVCACALFILSHTRAYGAGRHVYDISYHDLQRFAMILYPLETVFNTAFWPIKISFLVFYHSLSPQLLYNRAVLFVGVFITVWILTGDFIVFFQCRPLAYWDHLVDGKCLDRKVVFTAWGAINLLTDFAVLLLPVPVVMRLQLKKREKAAVLSIFATGAFICIVGINRLITLRVWLQHADTSYLFGKTAVWSLMEIDLALIISCVPALKVLLVRPSMFPVSAIKSRLSSRQEPSRHRPSVPAIFQRKESVSGTASNSDSKNEGNFNLGLLGMQTAAGLGAKKPATPGGGGEMEFGSNVGSMGGTSTSMSEFRPPPLAHARTDDTLADLEKAYGVIDSRGRMHDQP